MLGTPNHSFGLIESSHTLNNFQSKQTNSHSCWTRFFQRITSTTKYSYLLKCYQSNTSQQYLYHEYLSCPWTWLNTELGLSAQTPLIRKCWEPNNHCMMSWGDGALSLSLWQNWQQLRWILWADRFPVKSLQLSTPSLCTRIPHGAQRCLIQYSKISLLQWCEYMEKSRIISHSKFIPIFIVFRNPRFIFFFLYHLQQGRMRDKLKVMPFPSRRDALQDGLKWRKRVKYIKCFCQHFLLFNRKKDQNKRFEGGGSGNRALGSWHQQWRWRRWNDDEEEERCGGIYLKKKKRCLNEKNKTKITSGLSPGWGWTCHRVGFFGHRRWHWHFPTARAVVGSPSAVLALRAPRPPKTPELQQRKTHIYSEQTGEAVWRQMSDGAEAQNHSVQKRLCDNHRVSVLTDLRLRILNI